MRVVRMEFEAWVRAVAPGLAASHPAQIDIDELLDPPPANAIWTALGGIQLMRDALQALELRADVMLVVPLPVSVELMRDHPGFDDLVADEWSYGPGREVPGFYLLPPSVWRVYEPSEDYRRAIETDLLPPGFAAYYRTWRTLDDEVRGWEYARAVYVRTI
jgi:hypothetical protein